MTFVFDLDGTLCFNDEPISYEIHQELKSLKEENLEVIFASARPIRDMLPVIHEDFHQHILIGGNGSLISRKGKVRIVKSFSKDELNKILALIEKYEATYLIDSKWNYAYTGSNNHPILKNLDVDKLANQVNLDELNEIVKILILSTHDFDAMIEDIKKLNVSVNIHKDEGVIDISPKSINKYSALNSLGKKVEYYVAFGNDTYDIELFENALYSVMVGHNHELEKYARESIPASNEKISKKIKRLGIIHSVIK